MITTKWTTVLLGANADNPPCQTQAGGWTKIFHKDGIVVASGFITNTLHKAYRAKGTLNAPIDQILEVLADTPLATQWIPDLSYKKVINDISAIENITHSIYAVSFPFRDREFILHNQLRIGRDRSALVAEAVSIDHPKYPLTGRHLRAQMICGQTWLQPLSNDRTAVEFILSIDLKGSIPTFLTTLGMRQAPFNFVKALEMQAQKSSYSLRSAYRELLEQIKKPVESRQRQ